MEFELEYTEQQEAFRKEVREWLEQNVPAGISVSPRDEDHPREGWERRRELGRRLGAKGWLWPTMPTKFGGGWPTADQPLIFIHTL